MKPLAEFDTVADYYTGEASKISRQLALAGIAIIWIFRTDVGNEHFLNVELIKPLIIFALSLIADLLQYFLPGILYTAFFLIKEREFEGKTDKETDAPHIFVIPGWFLYFTKIILLGVGYYLVLTILANKIVH